jgi:hypothetical protein
MLLRYGETEISEFGNAVTDQDVRWLDVTMSNLYGHSLQLVTVLLQKQKALHEMLHYADSLRFRDGLLALDDVLQVT